MEKGRRAIPIILPWSLRSELVNDEVDDELSISDLQTPVKFYLKLGSLAL